MMLLIKLCGYFYQRIILQNVILVFSLSTSVNLDKWFRNVWKKRGPLSLKSAFIHQQQTRAAKKEILIHLISSTKCRPCPQFFFCKLLVPELLSLTSSSLRIYLFYKWWETRAAGCLLYYSSKYILILMRKKL